MADDEQFSLCWNNFNSNLSAGFHESLCRGDLVDVTLTAEGQFVKAHRLVLSVCSPYFRKMFTQMPANQHAFVFLKDVSHSALKDLIQFMYCGEVNVKQEALPAFISTAEALQIKGLTDGEPAPSQSPAKPSTPAPQQVIPGPSMTAGSPRVKQRSSTTTRSYKIESEDSGDDKSTQLQQTSTQQTSQQNVVQQTQKRPAQRSITPHTAVTSVKRLKVNDPLETTEQAQITVQTVTDSKTSTDDPEFIDLPIDLPTKSEPDYTEEAGEVEAGDQEATYVEDDSYGDMKYDESYFTENDEGGASGTSATVKAATGTFSESYVSDTGEQSTTEAQDVVGGDIFIDGELLLQHHVPHQQQQQQHIQLYDQQQEQQHDQEQPQEQQQTSVLLQLHDPQQNPNMKFSISRRGGQLLWLDGLKYFRNNENRTNLFWRCHQYYRRIRCPVLICMNKFNPAEYRQIHQHKHIRPEK